MLLSHKTKIIVGYVDTDQMGIVHHSNYARYCEAARTDALKHLGASYRHMEEKGVMMPLSEMFFKFIRPAHYEDELTITTTTDSNIGARMVFSYAIRNQNGDLLCEATTTLGFLNSSTGRPCRPPAWFIELMAKTAEEKAKGETTIKN